MNSLKKFFGNYEWSQEQVNAVSFDLGNILIYNYWQEEVSISYPIYDEMYQIYKHGLIPIKYDPDSPSKFTVIKP